MLQWRDKNDIYSNNYTCGSMHTGDTIYEGEQLMTKLEYFSKLVGVTFEGRQDTIKRLKGDEPLRVRREADNQYDSNAVAVDVQTYYDKEFEEKAIENWQPIGYIAKDKNQDIAAALDAGEKVEIGLSSLTGGDGDKSRGVNVHLSYNKVEAPVKEEVKSDEPQVVTQRDVLEGFKNMLTIVTKGGYDFTVSAVKKTRQLYKSPLTGEEIEFDTDHRGYSSIKDYVSGSSFPEQFYAEFDADARLNDAVKKHGVTKEAVQAMWDLNRDASTGYGTAVHAALENFINNQELGDKLKSVKVLKTKTNVGPNKALSRNPFLKKIVEDFWDKFGDTSKRLTEVRTWDTARKLRGTLDLVKFVDEDKKIIRIQDFKTDGDIHEKKYQLTTSPFYKMTQGDTPKLGKELLDYHWFQLSFYANILTAKGYTVEGLDVFWLNPEKLCKGENAWELFSREALDLTEVI